MAHRMMLTVLISLSLLGGCSENLGPITETNAKGEVVELVPAVIKGKKFYLETALDQETRILGLSHRENLDSDRGMVFIFPTAESRLFVMRDCLMPIDIIFLTDNLRVINTHAMQLDPRKPREPDMQYERRLKRYASIGKCSIVIELAGGRIEELGLKPGDTVSLPSLESLKEQVE
ncbi:MAG: DUF192 domain-containing protein [Planctomycetota bacterium]